jgi:hypothetical protein
MRMKTKHLCGTIMIALGTVCGCIDEKKRPTPTPPTPQSAAAQGGIISAVQMEAPPGAPRDAQPTVPLVFQLVCYQLTVPVGTVSRNENFWKRIDETALDPARYDLLRRNGMRLGVAPVAEFDNIRGMLEDTPTPAKMMGTIGAEAKNMELPMRTEIPFETISFYGDNNEWAIRRLRQHLQHLLSPHAAQARRHAPDDRANGPLAQEAPGVHRQERGDRDSVRRAGEVLCQHRSRSSNGQIPGAGAQ